MRNLGKRGFVGTLHLGGCDVLVLDRFVGCDGLLTHLASSLETKDGNGKGWKWKERHQNVLEEMKRITKRRTDHAEREATEQSCSKPFEQSLRRDG